MAKQYILLILQDDPLLQAETIETIAGEALSLTKIEWSSQIFPADDAEAIASLLNIVGKGL